MKINNFFRFIISYSKLVFSIVNAELINVYLISQFFRRILMFVDGSTKSLILGTPPGPVFTWVMRLRPHTTSGWWAEEWGSPQIKRIVLQSQILIEHRIGHLSSLRPRCWKPRSSSRLSSTAGSDLIRVYLASALKVLLLVSGSEMMSG